MHTSCSSVFFLLCFCLIFYFIFLNFGQLRKLKTAKEDLCDIFSHLPDAMREAVIETSNTINWINCLSQVKYKQCEIRNKITRIPFISSVKSTYETTLGQFCRHFNQASFQQIKPFSICLCGCNLTV